MLVLFMALAQGSKSLMCSQDGDATTCQMLVVVGVVDLKLFLITITPPPPGNEI